MKIICTIISLRRERHQKAHPKQASETNNIITALEHSVKTYLRCLNRFNGLNLVLSFGRANARTCLIETCLIVHSKFEIKKTKSVGDIRYTDNFSKKQYEPPVLIMAETLGSKFDD